MRYCFQCFAFCFRECSWQPPCCQDLYMTHLKSFMAHLILILLTLPRQSWIYRKCLLPSRSFPLQYNQFHWTIKLWEGGTSPCCQWHRYAGWSCLFGDVQRLGLGEPTKTAAPGTKPALFRKAQETLTLAQRCNFLVKWPWVSLLG